MAEEEAGEAERRAQRHAARTHLNHVAGYADILRQEALDLRQEELAALYDRLRAASLELRDLVLSWFRDPATSCPDSETSDLERGIYGLLYDIIALVQTAKSRAKGELASRFVPDTEKILQAANSIIELFEARLESGDDQPGAAQRRCAEPEKLVQADFGLADRRGRILVVDDDQFNREILALHLERQGHVVCQAQDGASALAILAEAPFDLIIMDVMMPGMNGYQLLEAVKSDKRLASIHVIVISALEDTRSIARCIQLGAEDYLPREFEPTILRARIESCLEKRSLKDKEELYVAAVRAAQRDLEEGLAEGADYIRGLLPARLDTPTLRSDWVFLPSRSLGGDVFGYHRLDDGRLAIYLLDVSGHGIGAALYSASIMNILKTQSLPGTDFGEPASVLSRLNESFQMEGQNNLYVTAWYGVWDEASRELRFASAGGPPALLIQPGGAVDRLSNPNVAVGLDLSSSYEAVDLSIPPGSILYLFSDGAFEIRGRDGGLLGIDTLVGLIVGAAAVQDPPILGNLVEILRSYSGLERFEDDVSLVEFRFG